MKKEKPRYPLIEDYLIQVLKEDFPDKLPEKEIDKFELGFLIGQQSVIKKLEFECREQEES